MTDIGKGDVVVAIRQRLVASLITGRGIYIIMPGQRAIVAAVVSSPRSHFCDVCGDEEGPGLLLEEYPLREGASWCGKCEWRKFGKGKDEHVAQFAGYLKQEPILAPDALRKLGLA